MSDAALAGCGVLVTRPVAQAETFAAAIEAAGGRAVRFPVVDICGRQPEDVVAEFLALPKADLVIFVSRNAAHFGSLILAKTDAQIAVIGPATGAAIEAAGGSVDIAPEQTFDSEHLLAHTSLTRVAGKSITIVRGDSGRELLGTELRSRGAEVRYLSAYRRQIRQASADDVAALDELWRRGEINIATVMSVGSLEFLLQLLLPSSVKMLRKTPLVAPGARVIQTALELLPGQQTVEASGPGVSAMVRALIKTKKSGLLQ